MKEVGNLLKEICDISDNSVLLRKTTVLFSSVVFFNFKKQMSVVYNRGLAW